MTQTALASCEVGCIEGLADAFDVQNFLVRGTQGGAGMGVTRAGFLGGSLGGRGRVALWAFAVMCVAVVPFATARESVGFFYF